MEQRQAVQTVQAVQAVTTVDVADTTEKIGRFSLKRVRLEITRLFPLFLFDRIDSLRHLKSKRRFKQILSPLPPQNRHLISSTVIKSYNGQPPSSPLFSLSPNNPHNYKQKSNFSAQWGTESFWVKSTQSPAFELLTVRHHHKIQRLVKKKNSTFHGT